MVITGTMTSPRHGSTLWYGSIKSLKKNPSHWSVLRMSDQTDRMLGQLMGSVDSLRAELLHVHKEVAGMRTSVNDWKEWHRPEFNRQEERLRKLEQQSAISKFVIAMLASAATAILIVTLNFVVKMMGAR